jgi:pantetheine-phosphate adenylyltransferase
MRRAIYPGSFDPVTNGHLDIIERSSKLFDEIVIAVLNNPDKNPMFTVPERCQLIRDVLSTITAHECNFVVEDFAGLTVEFAQAKEAGTIVRGIRAISDYEYELQMAAMNRRLGPELETVFMMAAEQYSFVSSKLVKQVFALGGVVDGLVPELVQERMREKLNLK